MRGTLLVHFTKTPPKSTRCLRTQCTGVPAVLLKNEKCFISPTGKVQGSLSLSDQDTVEQQPFV